MVSKNLLGRIKQVVSNIEPGATVILFGSHTRSDHKENSDIDLLILVERAKVSYEDEKRIKYPLYDLEYETGKVISPVIITRNAWETSHSITPFYLSVQQEGILI